MHILYGTSAVQSVRVMTSRTDHLYLKKNPILIKIMGAYRGCSVPLYHQSINAAFVAKNHFMPF